MHPQILSALGKMGHGSRILISDGGYPHITHSNPAADKVYLNLSPGILTVSQILEALKEIVPIEEITLMTPPDGTMQPVFEEYKRIAPADVPFNYVTQFPFYELAQESNIGLVIATGDVRNYANMILKVGFIKHPEGIGTY
jgi:L-fucose mutarotase